MQEQPEPLSRYTLRSQFADEAPEERHYDFEGNAIRLAWALEERGCLVTVFDNQTSREVYRT